MLSGRYSSYLKSPVLVQQFTRIGHVTNLNLRVSVGIHIQVNRSADRSALNRNDLHGLFLFV